MDHSPAKPSAFLFAFGGVNGSTVVRFLSNTNTVSQKTPMIELISAVNLLASHVV